MWFRTATSGFDKFRFNVCGRLHFAIFEARRWYGRKKRLNVNTWGTLWMPPEKEVANNAEVSDSDTFFVLGVHNGNVHKLR